jgi:hypothetical protein
MNDEEMKAQVEDQAKVNAQAQEILVRIDAILKSTPYDLRAVGLAIATVAANLFEFGMGIGDFISLAEGYLAERRRKKASPIIAPPPGVRF